MKNKIDSLTDNEELQRYSAAVNDYLNVKIDQDQLMAIRLQQGIYSQRQDGVNMIRIKLPGGRIKPLQLMGIGSILERFSNDHMVNLTTRQDIQMHTVALQDTPQVLHELAALDLTTREACGNTVRNICACPLAGVCPREHVDVQPFIERTAQYFMRHPLTQHMPRKFKMSFSGCELDCAQGKIHDLAVVATSKNNQFGFKVLAGGGLGHKPREAVVIESFISESELFVVIEAVITLHNRYSNRKKRAKSRIKFLVERFGEKLFIEKYKLELIRTRDAQYADAFQYKGHWKLGENRGDYGIGAPRSTTKQKQLGLFVMPIAVPLGDLTAPQLKGLANLLLKENINDIRVTQDQNLILLNVKQHQLTAIKDALQHIDLTEPQVGDNVVSCPGTLTCRLGITASRQIAADINGGINDLLIRVSGCQNGCAQPTVSDIGIHGEAKRLFGKLIPHYRLYLGGDGRANGRIGVRGPDIPVVRIKRAINRIQQAYLHHREVNQSFQSWNASLSADYYNELLADLVHVVETEVPQLLVDYGSQQQFRVLQLGGGECAAASNEIIAANFSEAANERAYLSSFLAARKYAQAIDCAASIIRLVSQSLLHTTGNTAANNVNIDTLEIIAKELEKHFFSDASLVEPIFTFLIKLNEFEKTNALDINETQQFDVTEFNHFLEMVNCWTVLAANICQQKYKSVNLSQLLPSVFQDSEDRKSVKPTSSELAVSN